MKQKIILLFFILYSLWICYIFFDRKLNIDILGCYKDLPRYHYVEPTGFFKEIGKPGGYIIKKPLQRIGHGVFYNRIFNDSCEAKIYFFKNQNLN